MHTCTHLLDFFIVQKLFVFSELHPVFFEGALIVPLEAVPEVLQLLDRCNTLVIYHFALALGRVQELEHKHPSSDVFYNRAFVILLICFFCFALTFVELAL